MAGVVALAQVERSPDTGAFQGLPPMRAYSLEDIGYVARGPNLDFDRFGRLAVIQEGIYAVLNDTVWSNLADDDPSREHVMVNAIQGGDGRAYYGSRENWGIVEAGTDGRLQTHSLAPSDPPKWVQTALFGDILTTRDGAYFASWNGAVFWDFEKQQNQFFAINGVSCLFSIGDRVYLSSLEQPIQYLDPHLGALSPVITAGGEPLVIEHAARLDAGRVLVAEAEGRIMEFDGTRIREWAGQARNGLTGHIGAMHGLVDGGVAIALVGRGLYLLDADGRLRVVLNTPQYHRITDIASRESGVLWVATEDTIEKVLYGSSLTTFGQKLGLTLSWPLVERWRDRLLVASEGRLFEAIASDRGFPSRFELVPEQPPGGAWSMAARGQHMLVGGSQGVFSMAPDGTFTLVDPIKGLAHLVMVGKDLCFAIGQGEIAVFRWLGDRWGEAAPRVPGLAYSPVVHGTEKSVWVEMGGSGVARVWLDHGELRVEVFESDGWTDAPWVNVGAIDDLVVLSASRGVRRFFDEGRGQWCEAPAIEALLDRPSQWIARVRKDERGVIWATHNEGVIAFTPKDGDYVMDTTSFDQINDRYPTVHILPGSDVWISAGQSLHHVESRRGPPSWEALRPVMVSVLDTRTDSELLPQSGAAAVPLSVSFAQNSLSFRVFAGGYGWRRAPIYEFRLGDSESWTTLDSGSLLNFRGLREGAYQLQVRIAGSVAPTMAMAEFPFEVRPPWHRTPSTYLASVLLVTVAVVSVVRWSSHLVRKRNRVLEELVHERTSQLEMTMEKLNEETRNAATLAERDRLAGEIHDSMQQGLSGAILQLDTTLKLPSVPGEIRSRLNVVRNMVSYTRQEVQHAVWDMESPLSEGVDLEEALRRLAAVINSCTASIEVDVEGEPCTLSRTTKHNLLRIAQEATTNAVRHASATRIRIHLLYAPHEATLTVSDDGVGFDPGAAMNGNVGHFGLRGIRSRAKKLDGQLSIESSPGSGASIRLVVPLSSDEEKNTL